MGWCTYVCLFVLLSSLNRAKHSWADLTAQAGKYTHEQLPLICYLLFKMEAVFMSLSIKCIASIIRYNLPSTPNKLSLANYRFLLNKKLFHSAFVVLSAKEFSTQFIIFCPVITRSMSIKLARN